MSIDALADLWVHQVTVEQYQGESASGPIFAPPEALPQCLVEDKVRLVTDAAGEQVVSNTTIYAPTEYGDLLTAKSKVTMTSGRETRVITRGVLTSGDLGLPDHVAAVCE